MCSDVASTIHQSLNDGRGWVCKFTAAEGYTQCPKHRTAQPSKYGAVVAAAGWGSTAAVASAAGAAAGALSFPSPVLQPWSRVKQRSAVKSRKAGAGNTPGAHKKAGPGTHPPPHYSPQFPPSFLEFIAGKQPCAHEKAGPNECFPFSATS